MSKPYFKNLEYLQATVEACQEMISPEILENLIQSISYQIKSVINAKGYFPLK
jgi:fructose/tagatose bisphosphate aldolase